MIPKHKCTAYCDPDEGVHCLPNTGLPGLGIEVFRRYMTSVHVIKISPEDDVTNELAQSTVDYKGANFSIHFEPNHTQGYLVWIREKEPA